MTAIFKNKGLFNGKDRRGVLPSSPSGSPLRYKVVVVGMSRVPRDVTSIGLLGVEGSKIVLSMGKMTPTAILTVAVFHKLPAFAHLEWWESFRLFAWSRCSTSIFSFGVTEWTNPAPTQTPVLAQLVRIHDISLLVVSRLLTRGFRSRTFERSSFGLLGLGRRGDIFCDTIRLTVN